MAFGGIISTGNHPKALWPGVEGHWWGVYKAHERQYDKIFDTIGSNKNFEEFPQSTGFPLAVVKDETAGITYASNNQGYITRAIHVVYGLGYIVTEEEIEDNLYEDKAFDRASRLAFSMHTTKETIAANMLNRAGTSGYTFGDGQTLLSTSHPTQSGGSFSNQLSTSAAMSEAALEDIVTQIMGATNDEGLYIALQPHCVIIPRALWYETTRILESDLQANTNNNAANVLKMTNTFPGGIVMNTYLTDSNNWFVKTGAEKGLMYLERRPIKFMRDNDFNTGNALAKATERYSFTSADPRGIYGSLPA